MENKEIKELIRFIVCVANAGFRSAEDGEISISDARFFFSCISLSGAAFDNLPQALEEFKNLSPQGARALIAEAKRDFDISDNALERKIEDALDGIYRAYQFYGFIKGYLG